MAFAVSTSRAVVAAPAAAKRASVRAAAAAPKKALRLNAFTGMKVSISKLLVSEHTVDRRM